MKKTLSSPVQLRDVEPADLPILFQHQLDREANRMAVANVDVRSASLSAFVRCAGLLSETGSRRW